MPEKIGPEVRSRMMSGIRGRDTKPELQIRKHLHAQGFRFRLFRKDLPGNPDIVLPVWKTAVLAHGCFWHGHEGCPYFRIPKTRPEFWADKIGRNVERDARSMQALRTTGWRVAVVWECALRENAADTLDSLVLFLQGDLDFAVFSAATKAT